VTAGRKPNVEPSHSLHLALPQSLKVPLDLFLFSEAEQRVPKGAYMSFFSQRIVEFFASRALDLSPYTGSLPGEHIVRGSPETLAALQSALERPQP
jgi:hypothetical protein